MKTVEFKEAEFYLGLNGVPFFFFKVSSFSPINYLGWCVGKQGNSLLCCHLGTMILSFVCLPSFVAAEPSASNYEKQKEQPIARHSGGILSQSWTWHVRFLVTSIPYMTKSNQVKSLEMRTSCLPRNKQRMEFGRWRA